MAAEARQQISRDASLLAEHYEHAEPRGFQRVRCLPRHSRPNPPAAQRQQAAARLCLVTSRELRGLLLPYLLQVLETFRWQLHH